MVANLEQETQWAMEILAKDEFFAQMTKTDQERIIAEAIDFGTHLAEKTL